MAEPAYDIFFKGEALDGFTLDTVTSNFCKLFKTSDEKAARFFSGKTVALKRNIDKPTTIKFQAALKKAGLKIYIRAAAPTKPIASVTKPQLSEAVSYDKQAAPASTIELAPVGANVLNEAQRRHQVPVDIDTSGISLASQFAENESTQSPIPVEIDTHHLSTAEVGADILEGYLPPAPPPAPDVSHINIDQSGDPLNADTTDIPLPEPDISHITLAEPGAQIGTPDKSSLPAVPSTDHIQLV